MSHNETAAPSTKMAITPATGEAPPWAGKKFTCSVRTCQAEYQLEAADHCQECRRMGDFVSFVTPPCWDCGYTSIVEIAIPSVLSDPSVPADENQEANPS
jgi:hypothetical protein